MLSKRAIRTLVVIILINLLYCFTIDSLIKKRHPVQTTVYRNVHLKQESVPVVQETEIVKKDEKGVWWVIIVHMSGKSERKEVVESTWARKTSNDVEIVTFTGQQGRAYLSTREAFALALARHPNAEWFSKFDDDSYVYTRNLAEKLQAFDMGKPWYVGYALKNGIVFGSGGAGYTLNKNAATVLIQDARCAPNLSEYEDLGVGMCMEMNGIGLTHQTGLHPHNHWQMLRWDKFGHSPDHVYQDEGTEGYLKPLSYHYVSTTDMLAMHDDFHLYGLERRRVKPLPKIIHQFWVGDNFPPHRSVESCVNIHPGWDHRLWNDKMIKERFPNGELVNQDFYTNSYGTKNLLSDIARYEFLLFWGGVYMDADSVCVQPLDSLFREILKKNNTAEGFCVYENEHRRANVDGYMLIATGVLALYPFSPLAVVLVKELQRTNWAAPAWISAGPLYATKLLAKVSADIAHMPSHSFYPYHFEDTPPGSRDERLNRLRQANSFTDQIWGTTRSRYMGHSGERCPVEKMKEMLSSSADEAWSDAGPFSQHLREYTLVHERLMTAPIGSRVRYLVPDIDSSADECSRKLHLSSALLLSMLTGRALLFDWPDDFFASMKIPPIAFSLSNAERYIGEIKLNAPVKLGDFLVNVKTGDIDSEYPQETIVIPFKGEFWASLLFHNPRYRHELSGLSGRDITKELFNYLFRSKKEQSKCVASKVDVDTSTVKKGPPSAIVFNAVNADLVKVTELRASIAKLHEQFNSKYHYPIVLFVSDKREWYHLQNDNSARILLFELRDEYFELSNLPDLQRFERVLQLDFPGDYGGVSVSQFKSIVSKNKEVIRAEFEIETVNEDKNLTVKPVPTFQNVLDEYSRVHGRLLRQSPGSRVRVVVASFHPASGMCNRIMHILSCMAFAIVTERLLVFEWAQQDAKVWYQEQRESIGHADFFEVFERPSIDFRMGHALKKLDIKLEDVMTVSWSNPDFLTALRTKNLDSVYYQQVVAIERYDWWGAVLFSNPHYKSVLGGESSAAAFAQMFKFMFRPKSITLPPSNECDALLQVRVNWERKTAPVSSFFGCANTPKNRWLLSDTKLDSFQDTHVFKTGCREGTSACELEAINAMYWGSTCKKAVITHTSTYGACIVGLGQITNSYVVRSDGSCSKTQTVDPIDAGVLDSQTRDITAAINSNQEKSVSGAFLYLAYNIDEAHIEELRATIEKTHTHFNQRVHYPIVLFVNNKKDWELFQSRSAARIHLVQVDEKDWVVPENTGTYPEIWKLTSSPEHKGFNVQYRQMSRYSAGYLFNHPFLERFDYVLKLDGDTESYKLWTDDPIERMKRGKKRYGFWILYQDTPDVTVNLWKTFEAYLSHYNLKLKQRGLLVDQDGNYKHTTFYGCFIGFETEFFRRPEYKQLFDWFDKEGGWFKYRWDEQKIQAFYVALYLEASDVEYFDYVGVEHQVWATSARGGPL